MALGASIRDDGLRHPITLWKDGTIISGGRRLRAYLLMDMPRIQAVFVDNIEDAAKRMLADNEDDLLALPWKWSEVCRLWEMLRRLDAPPPPNALTCPAAVVPNCGSRHGPVSARPGGHTPAVTTTC